MTMIEYLIESENNLGLIRERIAQAAILAEGFDSDLTQMCKAFADGDRPNGCAMAEAEGENWRLMCSLLSELLGFADGLALSLLDTTKCMKAEQLEAAAKTL